MSKSLSARHQIRMTLLPTDPIGESRRGARSSAAMRIRISAGSDAQPAEHPAARPEAGPDTAPESQTPSVPPRPAIRSAEDGRTADRYANAGPDCFWPERG